MAKPLRIAFTSLVVGLVCGGCNGGFTDPESYARDALAQRDIHLPGGDAFGPDAEMTDASPRDASAAPPPSGVPNQGWIGGACATATDCDYTGATCLGPGDGYPGGMCTQACDRLCPDRAGDNSVTFCANAPAGTPLAGDGQCIARCDFGLYPGRGCRDDYVCRTVDRFGEPGTDVAACVRMEDGGGALSDCLARLDALGIHWSSWAHNGESPDGRPDLTCSVDDPIRVESPINGVDWRYYSQSAPNSMAMSCDLAVAMHQLGGVLQDYGITDVLHIGTYNCRKIGDGNKLSQHALGLAVDIFGFEDDQGREILLEDHWEHEDATPESYEGQVLWEIAQRMHDDRIFNVVLTPNYNAAHDNHFHIDLTAGSHFIGLQRPMSNYHLGPNPGDAGCFETD